MASEVASVTRSSIEEGQAVSILARRALALRVTTAIAIHFGLSQGFFAPDQVTYDYGAARVAEWLAGAAPYPYNFLEASQAGYYWIVGLLYFVLGTWDLLPKLLNCLVGAYVVKLTYRLARAMTTTHDVALRAAQLTAYLPSMVLWSTLNIRDEWVVLVILLAANAALALQEEFRFGRLALLAASLGGLIQLRGYLLFAVAGPIVVALVAQRGKRLLRNSMLGMAVGGIVMLVSMMSGTNQVLRSADLEILQQVRQGTAIGGESNFATEVDISTPWQALLFLPMGLAFFLFAPFPWAISGARQLVTLPEMLYIYTLVPAMARGLATLVRYRLRGSLAAILMTVGLTFGYALGQANAGTAYRHRAQVLPFLMILVAAGEATRGRGPLGRPAPAAVAAAAAIPATRRPI